MVDAFTTAGVGSLGTSLLQTGYDTLLESQNRHAVVLRRLADKTPGDITNPGAPVVLQRYNDLVVGSRELLSETTDPDAVAVPSTSSVSIAYREFGNVIISTRKLHHVSLSKVDPIIASVLARDLQVSLDDEVGAKAYGGTKVSFGGTATSTATVTAAMIADAADFRTIVNRLRVRAAAPRRGDLFAAYVHPNVAYDLRTETGTDGKWRDDHKYTSPDLFWSGEVGVYEGAFFIESARMKVAADGAAAANVYRSLITGAQALAEVVWEEPHTVVDGVIVNKLRRFFSIGWYGALNWGIYRDDNLHRLETAATLSPTA